MSELSKILNAKNVNLYFIMFLVILFLIYLFEVITPFAIAFIIAYLINPLKLFLDQYLNKTFSSFLSVIIFILGLVSILIIILPVIIQQIQFLITILPTYLTGIEKFIKEINSQYLFSEKLKTVDYTNLFRPVINSFISSGSNLIGNGIEFFNNLFNIVLILVISFYMSLEFNRIKLFLYDFAKKSHFEEFPSLINEIDIVLSKFIRGQGLICLILSIFYAGGLFLVGMKFGILIGLFSGIMSFVPFVGSFLGGGLTLLLGFAQFSFSFELIILLSIFFCGQLFESYYLTPKLIGNAIKLNPIWIIFALLTGAYLSGFVGVLIALPVAAILGVLVRYYFIKLF